MLKHLARRLLKDEVKQLNDQNQKHLLQYETLQKTHQSLMNEMSTYKTHYDQYRMVQATYIDKSEVIRDLNQL